MPLKLNLSIVTLSSELATRPSPSSEHAWSWSGLGNIPCASNILGDGATNRGPVCPGREQHVRRITYHYRTVRKRRRANNLGEGRGWLCSACCNHYVIFMMYSGPQYGTAAGLVHATALTLHVLVQGDPVRSVRCRHSALRDVDFTRHVPERKKCVFETGRDHGRDISFSLSAGLFISHYCAYMAHPVTQLTGQPIKDHIIAQLTELSSRLSRRALTSSSVFRVGR